MKIVVLLKLHFVKFVIFLGNIIVLLRSLSRILVSKFESTGSVQNVPTPTRVRPGRSTKNIAAVSHSVEEDQKLSISRRSQQLGLSKSTTWRILRKDLALKPYKIQLVQELKLTNHSNRRRFAQNNLVVYLKKSFFQTKHIFICQKARLPHLCF